MVSVKLKRGESRDCMLDEMSVLVLHKMHFLLQNRNPGQSKAAIFTYNIFIYNITGKRYLCQLVRTTSGRIFKEAFSGENMSLFGLE